MNGENELSVETYCQGDEVILKISTYHKWGKEDKAHLALIVKEIRNHLNDFLNGKIFEKYPEAKDKDRVIEIVQKHPLSSEAEKLFKLVEKGGFSYRYVNMEP